MKKTINLLLIISLLVITPIISEAKTNVNETQLIYSDYLASSESYIGADFTVYSGRYYLMTDDMSSYYTNYYCDIAVSESSITYKYTLAGIERQSRIAYRAEDLESAGYYCYWSSVDGQSFGIYEDFLMVMEPNDGADQTGMINTDITTYIKLNL